MHDLKMVTIACFFSFIQFFVFVALVVAAGAETLYPSAVYPAYEKPSYNYVSCVDRLIKLKNVPSIKSKLFRLILNLQIDK